jgi:hypothetical protein
MKPRTSLNSILSRVGFTDDAIEKRYGARRKFQSGGEVDPRLTLADAEKLLEKNKKYGKHGKPRAQQPRSPYAGVIKILLQRKGIGRNAIAR